MRVVLPLPRKPVMMVMGVGEVDGLEAMLAVWVS